MGEGYSDQMLHQIQNMNWVDGPMLGAMSVVYATPGLIYLLLLKRYFEKPNQGEGNG